MRLEGQFILDKARPLMYANYLVFFSGQWEAMEMSYQGSDIVIFHFAKMSLRAVWEIDCREVRTSVSGPATGLPRPDGRPQRCKNGCNQEIIQR